jgi:hypothetical protein
MNDLTEAFGLFDIPEINAMIARDYVRFNSQRDTNDFHIAGPIFDFKKGATPQSQRMPLARL